jgi:hypothetical protein
MTSDREYQRLLLPCDPPLPVTEGGRLPSITVLWERAKMMFERVLKHAGSAAGFSSRATVTRRDKTELLGWLQPVERTVRSCLIVKAVNFLLMTVEGRKLMRETPKDPMPERPQPEQSLQPGPNSVGVTVIPYPGWNTIAQHRRALALRQQEQKARAEQRARAQAGFDRHDPSSWTCPFRVIGWKSAHPVEDRTAPGTPAPCGVFVLGPEHDPRARSRTPVPPAPGSGTPRLALRLARRIEAVSRVLAEPDKHTRTLARYLARLPLEALEGLRETTSRVQAWWNHGSEVASQGAAHVRRAATILLYRPDHPPEPA